MLNDVHRQLNVQYWKHSTAFLTFISSSFPFISSSWLLSRPLFTWKLVVKQSLWQSALTYGKKCLKNEKRSKITLCTTILANRTELELVVRSASPECYNKTVYSSTTQVNDALWVGIKMIMFKKNNGIIYERKLLFRLTKHHLAAQLKVENAICLNRKTPGPYMAELLKSYKILWA